MKRVQAFRQLAHFFPLLELAKAHRTRFLGFAGLFTIFVCRDQLYERSLLATQCSFFLWQKLRASWLTEGIAVLATPHKDAVVDHKHDSGREHSDEGNGEGGEGESRAISVHERKKEGEGYG